LLKQVNENLAVEVAHWDPMSRIGGRLYPVSARPTANVELRPRPTGWTSSECVRA
jgi:hypothetical protein